jgi:signal transduction histidine kinase
MKSIRKLYSQGDHPATNGPPGPANDPAGDRDLSSSHARHESTSNKKRSAYSMSTASMGDLAGVIIHEIRNPLTAISLANQALLGEIEHGDVSESLNPLSAIISKNISRIECLLHDLLYVSSGCNAELELSPTDLSEVIEKSLKEADDRIFLKKVEITKSYTPGILIQGNAEKLSVAFLNIIVNAIEAVQEYEGRIWITVYHVKDEVRVVFKDNGAGMEPEIATHMFDKNFSKKTKGLGVGLTHVKEIMDKHHATISVSSEPEIGTLIVIRFRAK